MIHDHVLRSLEGAPLDLATLRGKALLIVNVASRCGYTPQYAGLERLHREFGPRGFSVIGVPCNQFGRQEPGTAEEIREFCTSRYEVSFPLTEKLDVNGPGRHPLFAELTRVPVEGGEAGDVGWNFEKFVVSRDGGRVWRFAPGVTPESPELLSALEAALTG